MFVRKQIKLRDETTSSQSLEEDVSTFVQAVALKYEPEKDDAPCLIAKGRGEIAERIIEKAREIGIPIQEDPMLVAALYKMDLYQTIPPELYEVVAEVLAYIYRIRKSLAQR